MEISKNLSVPAVRGTQWSVALLGGLKRDGAFRAKERTVHVSAVGGAKLDHSEAQLPAGPTHLVKASLVGGAELTYPAGASAEVDAFSVLGGVDLAVPAGTTVEVSGFSLFGPRSTGVAGEVDGPVVKVRSYSLIGGVKVRQA
ncbi:hypothetical protein P3T35_001461 [Kitasatospora sp. GP30]|uniref:hypothetical protein n=1 Tax=Kitasatospora sp. GP30 TaxID=3035084 RepID=UPI000C6FF815|nr:hypothetical protein [Kitasatospora sp. GP30]MDH6139461.1 hypothetical protein [Kitasatospora sp. GP30]